MLLSRSDDALPDIVTTLAEGGTEEEPRKKLREMVEAQQKLFERPGSVSGPKDLLGEEHTASIRNEQTLMIDIKEQQHLIATLTEFLRDRTIFTLAEKWRIEELGPVPETTQHEAYEVHDVITWYSRPNNRALFIDAVEQLCKLPRGSLIIYVPPSSRMNAKIADVKLLIDGRVHTFSEYEERYASSSLTAGALKAQVRRFFYLWSAQFFVERALWNVMDPGSQEALRSVLRKLFYLAPGHDPVTARRELEVSVQAVANALQRAARRRDLDDGLVRQEFEGKRIMNRMPIICP
jgi:hypothetical protein